MLLNVLLNVVANIAILTLVSYIYIKIIPKKKEYKLTRRQKAALVLLASMTAFILMSFSVDLPQQVKVDMRYNVMILLLYYIGPDVFVATSILTAGLRLTWGISDASVYTLIFYLVLSVTMPIVSKSFSKRFSKRFNSYATGLILNTYYIIGYGIILYFIYYDWKQTIAVSLFNLVFTSICLMVNIMFIEDMRADVRRYLDEIERAKSDYLTGLYNRREFSSYWRKIENDKKITHVALLMLDIDHFKHINDYYGHVNGDLVLQQVSDLLHISGIEHEHIYRVGGEEFCIVLNNKTFSDQMRIAEEILTTIEEKNFVLENHQTIHLTISIGMATSNGAKDMKNLYRLADRALYRAKDLGRNQIVSLDLTKR